MRSFCGTVVFRIPEPKAEIISIFLEHYFFKYLVIIRNKFVQLTISYNLNKKNITMKNYDRIKKS